MKYWLARLPVLVGAKKPDGTASDRITSLLHGLTLLLIPEQETLPDGMIMLKSVLLYRYLYVNITSR
jgi:hypothetical protein